jgi:phage-related minor tail protein
MSSATQNRRINLYINGKEIQNNMKSIRAEYRKSVAEINKMQRGSKEYQKQAKKIRELRGVMDQHRNDLGRATTAWGGLKNVVLGVFGGNLLMNGFNLLRRAVTGAINNIKEYQQANANLASILQVSREEIGALADESQRLGASTAFTATEVANLQTEFAKLGFTQNEIISATEATLALAAAARVDLAEAATVAGSTVRAFGLETTETQRVVDVMAQSFGDSALDFEKFRESMKYVAPVAKAAGISIEETTALLAQLSNAGISGRSGRNRSSTNFK